MSVRTVDATSSRADTARTRRRYLRPALAPAPIRERAGRLARDMGFWLCFDCVREREARIVRSHPPASSPLRVPIPPAPAQVYRWALIVAVSCGYVGRPCLGVLLYVAIRVGLSWRIPCWNKRAGFRAIDPSSVLLRISAAMRIAPGSFRLAQFAILTFWGLQWFLNAMQPSGS